MNLYHRVLIWLKNRKRSYQLTFGGPAGKKVLMDLAEFCHADTSTFDENERIHAALEGRREVWLRIQQHLYMSPEELAEIYHGARQQKKEITQ